ncbi:uncharacterized protein BKA55DRAFT_583661 [Fusarium redolens]|uniref:Protein kinase domain-containing protein n=1 Tax=Fusarium redolens TaxID=48865 RepID=A0A9P9G1I4_FUSRE|nr:uncharacterized protein BKA55DRAFT_583661 [Fusarium redolens]KAH7228441.1 hypothetical protein BKA55DRAFT_583661 [Fusarium redolens]
MEHSDGIPSSPTSDILTEEVMQPEDTRFRFGTRTITARGGPADHCHHNVLCLRIQQTFLDRVVQSLFGVLSGAIGPWLQNKFPEWFLPERIVLKSQKPNWEEEFDKELEAYHKLQPLQGTVIPRFYGMIQFNDIRALILSDIGGDCLATPEGAVLDKQDLRPLLDQAFTSLADLGAYHDDIKLDNFHLVTDNGKDKIMVLDLESVSFELSGEDLSRVAKGTSNWLINQYDNHLECMEYDGMILPKRPLRT